MQDLDGDVCEEDDNQGKTDQKDETQHVGQLTATEVVMSLVKNTWLHVLSTELFWLSTGIILHPEKHLRR